jgi:hypothetical protein
VSNLKLETVYVLEGKHDGDEEKLSREKRSEITLVDIPWGLAPLPSWETFGLDGDYYTQSPFPWDSGYWDSLKAGIEENFQHVER